VSLSPIAACSSCPTREGAPGHRCQVYPSSSTTDAQWAILEPLLPPPGNRAGKGGRPESHCRRWVLDAIFYVVRGGVAWRQLPSDFPPAKTVYDIYRRWVAAGAWQRINDTLRDRLRVREGRNPTPTAAVIDSQSVQGSDTVPRGSRGYDAGKKTNGRKRHIAVDTGGLLLTVVVTVASIQDRDAAFRLLTALRAKFSTISLVWADGGYTGRLVEWAKTVLALSIQIVKRTDDTTGFKVLPRRWVVERSFGWILKHRRCVRDYETRPDHHEAMIYIAMIHTTSRRLARSKPAAAA
jgi:transposase